MKKKITAAAAILAASSLNLSAAHRGEEVDYLLSANTDTALFDKVLTIGTWDAELGLKFRSEDLDDGTEGHAGYGFLETEWESDAFHGFQLGLGGLAVLEVWGEDAFEDFTDENGVFADQVKLTKLYLKYAVPNTDTEILAGRGKFKKPASGDGDAHQGIQVTVNDIPYLTIYASAVNKWLDNASSGWDFDGIQEGWVDMSEVNTGKDGMGDAGSWAYTLMVKIEPANDLIALTPYVQYHRDVAVSLGLEVEVEVALTESVAVGLDGIFARHMEETPDAIYPDDEDVSQYLLHAYTKVRDFKIGFGYYHISNDIALFNGAGDPGDDFESVYVMDEFDPMEEDLAKYGEAPGNDTFFVDASCAWRFLELEAVYGWVENAWIKKTGENDGKARELDLVLTARITKNFDVELAYVRLEDEYAADGDDSMHLFAGAFTYSF